VGPLPADDLDQLDDLALDQLPFGVIGVGPDGTVRRYNRAEAVRSGLSRWRVIGRGIHEIAGAMGAGELASRVCAFAAAPTGGMRFECRLGRPGRADRATVVLRRGGARANVYVCIA
jgi:hypothetical protein